MTEFSGGKMFGYGDEPKQVEPKVQPKPERTREPLPPQVLLTWLRDNWKKPTISLRQVQVYGPRGSRDRETATKHIEALASYGWLAPIKSNRRDSRVWRLPPTVAATVPD